MSLLAWILLHKAALGSIIGAAYVLARLIIALTPTPKDDAALERISPFLRVLGALFGLDLKQGLNATPELTPLDPPPDLPSLPEPPPRTEGVWGKRNPRDLV
jgi:hypothetical protein